MRRSGRTGVEQWQKRACLLIIILLFGCSVLLLSAYRYGFSLDDLFGWTQERVILEPLGPETEWSYLDGGGEPGVGNVWTTERYQTTGWKTGTGMFAARDAAVVNTADVLLDAGEGEVTTYFFRSEFELEDPGSILAMEGEIGYSDAVLVYLNGQIIFAGNVPAGGYTSNQETGAANISEEMQVSQFQVLDTNALKKGNNILAVEVHQSSANRQTAGFFFSSFSLLGVTLEDEAPDTDGLVLTQGESEEQVVVNWLTSSPDFYQVEYLTAMQFDKREVVQEDARRILMGRMRTEQGEYVNTVALSRLQTGTTYYYRILRVGSMEGSAWNTFTTPGTGNYQFLFFAQETEPVYQRSLLQISLDYAGRTDFLLGAFLPQTSVEEGEWRTQRFLKEIPFAGVVSLQGERREDACGRAFTYQDSLVILLDPGENNFEQIREFVTTSAENNQRKWKIVAMYEDLSDMAGEQVAAYEELFHEIGADLVLCGESTSQTNLVRQGATVESLHFVNGGYADLYSGIQAEVGKDTITIRRWRLDSGEEEHVIFTK